MALTPGNDAESAFEAHAAMMRTQAREPKLFANQFWRVACDGAFARYVCRFMNDGTGR